MFRDLREKSEGRGGLFSQEPVSCFPRHSRIPLIRGWQACTPVPPSPRVPQPRQEAPRGRGCGLQGPTSPSPAQAQAQGPGHRPSLRGWVWGVTSAVSPASDVSSKVRVKTVKGKRRENPTQVWSNGLMEVGGSRKNLKAPNPQSRLF